MIPSVSHEAGRALRWPEGNQDSTLESAKNISYAPTLTPRDAGHTPISPIPRDARHTAENLSTKIKSVILLALNLKKKEKKKKQPFPILPFLTTPTPALLSPPPPPSSLRDWLYLKNYISAQAFKNAECLKQSSRISMFLTASWQLCGPRPASN